MSYFKLKAMVFSPSGELFRENQIVEINDSEFEKYPNAFEKLESLPVNEVAIPFSGEKTDDNIEKVLSEKTTKKIKGN